MIVVIGTVVLGDELFERVEKSGVVEGVDRFVVVVLAVVEMLTANTQLQK